MNNTIAVEMPRKTQEDATRTWARAWGDPRVLNAYLKVTIWGLGVIILTLIGFAYRQNAQLASVKPLVIRLDAVGRATAISYDAAAAYQPQDYEVRFFLKEWVVKHFSRYHSIVRRDFLESLYFVSPELSAAASQKVKPGGEIDTFLKSPAAEEVEVKVKNLSLSNLSKPPYEARVDYEQTTYAMGTMTARTRESFVAQITFTVLGKPPAVAFEAVNPLGFIITHYQAFQAFQQERPEQK
jgi:type IV secretory pathway TrbF-like protein